MGSKKRLLLLALAVTGLYVFAQEEEPHVPQETSPAATISTDHSLTPDGRSPLLFVHTLEWSPAEYSVSYVVILEQMRDGLFVEVLRRTVQTTSLEVSIPAGEYRFRVSGFNVLGRPDVSTDWEHLTITQALQPSIFGFSPTNFYFDRKSLRIINIEGVNLIVGSEFYLLRRSGKTAVPDESGEGTTYLENDILLPTEVRLTDLGDSAQLVFDEDTLVEGVFNIIVKNPGGFEDHAGPFGISVAKPWDLNVSIGYSPMASVSQSADAKVMLNRPGVPLGIGVAASFLPFKMDFGFIGVEMSMSWAYFNSRTVNSTFHSSLLSVHTNALYQYWYKKDVLAFNARLGLGASGMLSQVDFDTGIKSDSRNFALFSWGGGVSAMWLFYRQLYMEGGFGFLHALDGKSYSQSFMRFSLGLGWQF